MKILLIGQAPPFQAQEVPYDTTMLYDWLKEVGVSKDQAQDMFEFEAVGNRFPGFDNSGHKKPSSQMMDEHWDNTLKEKVKQAEKIWILGGVASVYLEDKIPRDKKVLQTIHPSTRNQAIFGQMRDKILGQIKNFLNT